MTPFLAMQAAVDIVHSSPHPTNKIAASLLQGDGGALISRTNYWPDSLLNAFGKDGKIGNSSGTIHAETACILHAGFAVQGASVCITDPFCPNCAKNMAEAGITKIYIDHKGFEKDFFVRRRGDFETMSMRICQKAGIAVYMMERKVQSLHTIYEPPEGYVPPDERPVMLTDVEDYAFEAVIGKSENRKVAVARAGRTLLTAPAHPVIGFDWQDDRDEITHPPDKYSFIQEPVNRLLMQAARRGLHIDQLYCSEVPTSREQVNLIGAGITEIIVGDTAKARDEFALKAMSQLEKAGLMRFINS